MILCVLCQIVTFMIDDRQIYLTYFVPLEGDRSPCEAAWCCFILTGAGQSCSLSRFLLLQKIYHAAGFSLKLLKYILNKVYTLYKRKKEHKRKKIRKEKKIKEGKEDKDFFLQNSF